MASTETAAQPGQQRSLLRRVLESGWLFYLVGFEVFLGVIVVLALQFMGPTPFQGVIVGMAISLAVLTILMSALVFLYITIRDRGE